jgi:hypothetical protein
VLNIQGDQLDLVIMFLLASLSPFGPYPVLYVSGEQGSAKSTMSRLVRSVVDPNVTPLRGDHRDPRNLLVASEHSWIVTMDNLSSMTKPVADGLCRLVSGTGHSLRQNYEDREEVIFTATRPAIINGIPELTIRQDLADRSLRVHCSPIFDEQRRPERELLAEFNSIHPQVLGALLDGASMAIRDASATRSRVKSLPRLADVALMAEAAGPAFGWGDGKAVALMQASRSHSRQLAVERDPVAGTLKAFAVNKASKWTPWAGSATELLQALGELDSDAKLPKAANQLSNRINELMPALRDEGVRISHHRVGHGSTREITIWYEGPPADGADDADDPSEETLQG